MIFIILHMNVWYGLCLLWIITLETTDDPLLTIIILTTTILFDYDSDHAFIILLMSLITETEKCSPWFDRKVSIHVSFTPTKWTG